MTQNELVRLVGISSAYLSQIMPRTRCPDLQHQLSSHSFCPTIFLAWKSGSAIVLRDRNDTEEPAILRHRGVTLGHGPYSVPDLRTEAIHHFRDMSTSTGRPQSGALRGVCHDIFPTQGTDRMQSTGARRASCLRTWTSSPRWQTGSGYIWREVSRSARMRTPTLSAN